MNPRFPIASPTPMRRIAPVLFVVLALLLASAVTFSPPANADPTPGTSPELTIVSLTPEILEDEDDVTLRVRVQSEDPAEVAGARIGVFMHADPFSSLQEIDAFLREGRSDSWSAGEVMLTDEEATKAGSGGVEVTVEMPTASLPLWNKDAWGPYGVTVRLLPSQYSYGGDVPQARTLLLWYPPGTTAMSRINVTVTGASALSPATWETLRGPGTTLALSPNDLVETLPRAGLDEFEVALVPNAQASLGLLASTEQDALFQIALDSSRAAPMWTGSTPPSAPDFEDENAPQSGDDEPAQSGDIEAGQDPASARSDDKWLALLKERNITVVEDVIVADEGWLSRRTLEAADASTVLSPPTGIRELFTSDGTSSSRIAVSRATGATLTHQGPITAMTPDVVPLLDSWRTAGEALATRSRDGLDDLSARQRVRAVSALATARSQGVLSLWVNQEAVSLGNQPNDRIAELLDVPWVRPATLKEMLRSPLSAVVREPIGDANPALEREVRRALEPLSAELGRAEAVLAASEGADSTADLALDSVLYATAPDLTETERQSRVSKAISGLTELTQAVEIVPSSTVNIVGRNAPFPVTITNNSPYALNLMVGLEASDGRLSTRDSVPVVVPSGGSVSTQVPVEAVGTGQVGVTVTVATSDGVALAVSSPIPVRVQADWEGPGIWVIGSLLGAAFVAGLVKTIRKGQRRMATPTTHVTDAAVSGRQSAEGVL